MVPKVFEPLKFDLLKIYALLYGHKGAFMKYFHSNSEMAHLYLLQLIYKAEIFRKNADRYRNRLTGYT